MGDHAGQLCHALERDLSPLASDSRGPERLHEVAGFRLQSLLRFCQELEVLVEASVSGLPRLLQLAELIVVSMQRVLKGFDQIIDRLLPLGEIDFSLGLERRE